uniref:Uncharacterized protein n=1 Tax=Eutreptiella gymnastica TaxID=73025 RepID=A0A7S4FSN1_9EUGL|mmetsp:Transcript_44788/g.72985  ORF Transcript_44788/g.72985 Transcript_44788/m.72985 type:complete len:172 (+) Transcript_44788:394-909(+)
MQLPQPITRPITNTGSHESTPHTKPTSHMPTYTQPHKTDTTLVSTRTKSTALSQHVQLWGTDREATRQDHSNLRAHEDAEGAGGCTDLSAIKQQLAPLLPGGMPARVHVGGPAGQQSISQSVLCLLRPPTMARLSDRRCMAVSCSVWQQNPSNHRPPRRAEHHATHARDVR